MKRTNLIILCLMASIPVLSQVDTIADNIYEFNGNLGIGTSTPDVRLRIEDSIDDGPDRALIRLKNLSTSYASSVSLALESNNNQTGMALTQTSEQFTAIPDFNNMGVISVNGKGFSVYSTSNYGSIRFYTNMDQDGIIERMRINHDGNIGIGTKNPLSKLEVNGMIHSTSEGFKFPDGTIQTTASNDSDTNYWKIFTNHIYYNKGNVGIGTDKPETKLHIRDTNSQYYIGYQPAYDGPYINLIGEVAGQTPMLGMGLAQKDYDYSGKIIARADWAYIYGNNYNRGMAILPDLAYAPDGLYIARGGLVGIGLSEPSTSLDIQGDVASGDWRNLVRIHNIADGFKAFTGIMLKTGSSGGFSVVQDYGINYTASLPNYDWAGCLGFGNNANGFIFHAPSATGSFRVFTGLNPETGAGYERFRITPDGNIGVGTTMPESKLEVKGLIHSTENGFKFPDGTIQTTAANGSDTSYWNLSGNDLFYDAGKVGIGTAEPDAKVEIANGDIYISDINSGIIMKSPDGSCWRGTVDNSGTLVFTIIDCPGEKPNPINTKSVTTNKITIFPNPVDNTVTIASLDGDFRDANAVIHTIEGKIVRKDALNNDYSIINLDNIPSGSYLIRVVNKRGKELGSETIFKK